MIFLLLAFLLMLTLGPPPAQAETPHPEFQQARANLQSRLRLSPDGRFLILETNREIQLWRTRDRRLLATLSGDFLHFTPDNRLCYYELGSGQVVSLDPSNPEAAPDRLKLPEFLTLSPDHRFFLTGSDEQPYTLCKVEDGSAVGTLGEEKPERAAAAFTPDGKAVMMLTSLGWELWDVERRVRLGHLRGGRLTAVAFHPEKALLAAGYEDRTLVVDWADHSTREFPLPAPSTRQEPGVRDASLSGNFLAVAEPGAIRVFDLEGAGREVSSLATSSETLTFGPEGLWLMGPEGVMTSPVEPPTTTLWAPRAEEGVPALSLDATGRVLVARYRDQIGVWNLETGQLRALFKRQASAVSLAPGGSRMAVITREGAVAVLDTASGKTVKQWRPPEGANGLAYSPDGRWLAVARDVWEVDLPTPVDVHDASSCRKVFTVPSYYCFSEALAWSPDSRSLVLSSPDLNDSDAPLQRVDVPSGRSKRLTLPDPVNWIAFAQSVLMLDEQERKLFSVSNAGQSREGLQMEGIPAAGDPFLVRLGADRAVIQRRTGLARIDRAGQKTDLEYDNSAGCFGPVASQDGRRVAAAFPWGEFRVWDGATGRQLLSSRLLRGPDRSAREWISWTPEGYFVGSGGLESLVMWRRGSELLSEQERAERSNPARVAAWLRGRK